MEKVLKYRRILLKLSGEALMGEGSHGIDPEVMSRMARDVGDLVGSGIQVALVIGGGNIFRAQALQSGKPEAIVEKMIDGRVRKYLEEVTLLGQPFVKDPDQTVEKLLKQAGARVLRFSRIEVGEGIEKRSENFAEEVMAQVRGT